MTLPPPSVASQHTVFSATYAADKGVQLQLSPFTQFKQQLTNLADYRDTQALGSAMRLDDVKAFEFSSARAIGGINVALFDPAALSCRQPVDQTQWLCRTQNSGVTFVQTGQPGQLLSFQRQAFTVDDQLPRPA